MRSLSAPWVRLVVSMTTSARSRSGASTRRSASIASRTDPVCAKRVTPPGFAEAPDEQLVARRPGRAAVASCGTYDAIDRGARVAKARFAAHVERDGNVACRRSFEGRYRGVEHDGRQVFDAVEAQILKRLNRLAQTRTGEARHEDDAQRTHMKLFSPERANALIPKLEPLVEELLSRRRALAIKLLGSRSRAASSRRADAAAAPRRRTLAAARAALRRAQTRDRAADLSDRIVRLRRQGHRSGARRFSVDGRGRAGLSMLEAGGTARRVLARSRRGLRIPQAALEAL